MLCTLNAKERVGIFKIVLLTSNLGLSQALGVRVIKTRDRIQPPKEIARVLKLLLLQQPNLVKRQFKFNLTPSYANPKAAALYYSALASREQDRNPRGKKEKKKERFHMRGFEHVFFELPLPTHQ